MYLVDITDTKYVLGQTDTDCEHKINVITKIDEEAQTEPALNPGHTHITPTLCTN